MKNLFQLLLSICLLCCAFGCSQKSSNYENLFEGAQDVGNIEVPGTFSFDEKTGIYTLTASGFNMWHEADAFLMAWKKVDGDFNMSADIAFEGEGFNNHRKIGIIVREALTDNAPYVDIAVHGGDGLTALQYRIAEGDTTAHIVSASEYPTSIYLERKGNVFLAKSGKGNLDISDTEIEMELPETCYVGLFMCSHETNILETAHFSNVKFTKE
jgi:hypothetical protein